MAWELDIEIDGCANNVPVEILGSGEVDGDRLRLAIGAVRVRRDGEDEERVVIVADVLGSP